MVGARLTRSHAVGRQNSSESTIGGIAPTSLTVPTPEAASAEAVAVPAPTAARAATPPAFLCNRGTMLATARVTAPTPRQSGSNMPAFIAVCLRISKALASAAAAGRPKTFGTWPTAISTPTPVVKPAITGMGVSFTSHPTLRRPERSCRAPTLMVIIGTATRPCALIAWHTSTDMTGEHPVTASVVPPIIAAMGAEMPALTSAT
mmetsp:Transcript_14232/g.42417  ORF Transcript_14232/g.42417 Transcript_14232/m.42417 type:complete len:205 (-) Transcript_14232:151-765(-)